MLLTAWPQSVKGRPSSIKKNIAVSRKGTQPTSNVNLLSDVPIKQPCVLLKIELTGKNGI